MSNSMGKPLDVLDIKYSLQCEPRGGYLPYPINLDPDLFVVGWRGPVDEGDKLIGFQRGSTQRLVLHTVDFTADPAKAEGLTPVFSNGSGFYAINSTIDGVHVF